MTFQNNVLTVTVTLTLKPLTAAQTAIPAAIRKRGYVPPCDYSMYIPG